MVGRVAPKIGGVLPNGGFGCCGVVVWVVPVGVVQMGGFLLPVVPAARESESRTA